MQYIIRGESIFIPFKNGRSISDSQCRPRIYKSEENFKKSFPLHNRNWNELIEYAEVKHGKWIDEPLDKFRKWKSTCSVCGWYGVSNYDSYVDIYDFDYCPACGAKMDKE